MHKIFFFEMFDAFCIFMSFFYTKIAGSLTEGLLLPVFCCLRSKTAVLK